MKSPRYQPLVTVLVALCAGIAADAYLAWPAPCSFGIALVSWAIWWVLLQAGCERLASCVLLASIAAVGAAWHHVRWNLYGADEIGLFAAVEPAPVCLEAVIRGGPRRVPAPPPDPLRAMSVVDRTRVEISLLAVRDGSTWREAGGHARLTVDGHLLGFHAGDRVRVLGQLSKPAPAMNPGEFDFALHARGDRRLAQVAADFPECVTLLEPASGLNIVRLLQEVRSNGDALLWRRLDHERSGLAAAMLLGVREELSDETTQAFVKTGTVHLLSISGLHMGILAGCLFGIMRLGILPRKAAIVLVALVTLAYTLLIDAEAPAMRATILVLILCTAQLMGRRGETFNCLAFAAIVVLALNPADLFRVGPQLSFLAMAALAWFGPRIVRRHELDPLARLISQTRPWPVRAGRWLARWTWQTTCLTGCVWAVTAPLVMAHFHLVSLATLVLTPLLALPVAVGMISGFMVLALELVLPPAAAASAWVCDLCLGMLAGIVDAASRVALSHFWVSGPAGWWLAVFYILIAVWVFEPRLRPSVRWCLAVLAFWSSVGVVHSCVATLRPARLECTFVAVGHGLAVVLRLPDGRTLLYDAGRLGSPAAATRSVSSVLWSRGITHLDAMIVSHADVDHYNGIPELLERFSVGVVYMSPMQIADESESTQSLLSSVRGHGVRLQALSAPRWLRSGAGCRIEVLHPLPQGVPDNDNANSLTLLVEYQGRRLLLTGDLVPPGMEDVLAEMPIDCDVVLAPHHGSAHSDPPGMAAWSAPEWLIISGGHERDSLPTAAAYAGHGARVLHTARTGAVHVTVADGELTVTTHLAGE